MNSEYSNDALHIFTDGGCRPNPGIGGYGYLFVDKGNIIHQCSRGPFQNTTNNKMELKAIIRALAHLVTTGFRTDRPIILYTDSQYASKGINEWSKKWERTDFKGVKNVGLWRQLLFLKSSFYLTVHHIKAHQKNPAKGSPAYYNSIADSLATRGRTRSSAT